MKKLLLIGLFGLLSLNAYAQEQDENATYNGEKYGYIIDKSGRKTEGVVHLHGGYSSPWQNQLDPSISLALRPLLFALEAISFTDAEI